MLAFGQQGVLRVHVHRLDPSNLGRLPIRRLPIRLRHLPILEALEHSAPRDACVALPQARTVEECQLLELLFF
jgi:hypothetical protein